MVKRCKNLPPSIRRLADLFNKADDFGLAQGPQFRYNWRKEMSSVANVERKIRRIEGFRVRILHLRGADVRGDRAGLPQYGYHRAAENDITVESWKATRFRPSYPGFEVDVVDRRGNSVQGNTKLETVRTSYAKK